MSPQNIRILEPQVVLTDILRGEGPVRKRRRNKNRILVPTTRRTRSSGLVGDNKDDVPKSLIPRERASTARVARPRRRQGRPLRVQKDNVVHAILRKRDDIVRDDGQLAPSSDPAWAFIKRELDNKIAVTTLHRIAERDMHKLLFGDQEPSDAPVAVATADVAGPAAHYRDDKATLEESTGVHDNTTVLGEANRDRDDPPAPVEQPNRERDNATVYEQLLLNLVNTIDCLNKEIKELTNELRHRNNLQRGISAC